MNYGAPPSPPPQQDHYARFGSAVLDAEQHGGPLPPLPPPQSPQSHSAQPAVYAASGTPASNGQPQRTSVFALFPSTVSVASSHHSAPPVPPTGSHPPVAAAGEPANSSAQPRKASIVRPGALADRNTASGAAQPSARRSVLAAKANDAGSVATQETRASRDAIPPNMNLKHQGKVIYMDKHQLQQFASTKEQHSLREISMRKRKQMLAKNALPAGLTEFCGLLDSEVIAPEEIDNLLLSLPFFTKPPSLRLLYSTTQHYRSLEELLAKAFKVRRSLLCHITFL
jgi:hypothetical protein